MTLSSSDLHSHTTACCSVAFGPGDTLILNSEPQDVSGARAQACFRELRTLRSNLELSDPSLPRLSSLPLRIISVNNFPTAAGLASSAAGFAALVLAIANLYQLRSSPTELSRIARQGSGSACRSLFGGYVSWQMGSQSDGSDSIAAMIAPKSHWPTIRALILIISAAKKDVSSTVGMQNTTATSQLFQHRVSVVVPNHMEMMQRAILTKDFELFAKVTMRESNSFHATCHDTDPPIFYLNDISRAAIRTVEYLNEKANRIIAAYTFDAGPNAVIYYQQEDENLVAGILKGCLGHVDGWQGRGAEIHAISTDDIDKSFFQTLQNGVTRVILTSVGDGPVSTEKSLATDSGEPLQN